MANVPLGIGIMLLSTTSMQIGQVLQKKAVDDLPPMEEQKVGENMKGVVTSKIWLFGWFLTTLAMVLNMVALGQADITVIQPLIGFGLVVLVVFSHYYLKEEVRKNEIIGIILAIIGVIVLGVFAEESQSFSNVDEVLSNYTQINAFIIIGIFLIVIISLWIGTRKSGSKQAGIVFASIASGFSVMGITFSKGLFSIIDIEGFLGALIFWPSYLLLLLFMSCSTMAIIVQNMSLQKGKSIVVTPVFNMGSIILPLATGAMVFSEVIGVGKILGTIIILIGAIFLSIKKENTRNEINEDKIQ
jgi:drug/metabolite transporter (DMT)-like permease